MEAVMTMSTLSRTEQPAINVPVEILRVANQIAKEPDQEGRTVFMVSALPGEGKTLMMHHLARALSRVLSQRVLVIELLQEEEDFLLPSELGPSTQPVNELMPTQLKDVMSLKLQLGEAHQYRQLQDLLRSYQQQFDVILAEGPAIQEAGEIDPIVLSPLFDMTLMVFQQQLTPANEIKDALALLKQAGSENVKLLINQSSMLDKSVSRWNLPARLPRFLARLKLLWRRTTSWWKAHEKKNEQGTTARKAMTANATNEQAGE